MSAYIIASIKVTDPEGYERYRQAVPGTIAAHGGRYLARGGAAEALEGDLEPNRLVIVEFPSYEQALAWYHSEEYQPIKRLRQASSESLLTIVDGC
jgi:uncharacterized protein (DUF1330 family)